MPRCMTIEGRKYGPIKETIYVACDKPLADKIRSLAIEEGHESPGRVIRRLLRLGAEAEGLQVYGD